MTEYIKNNHIYLGGIVFRIDPTAYLRPPNSFLDRVTLCPNIDPLNASGNWYVEWGIDDMWEGKTLQESALSFCSCNGDYKYQFGPVIHSIRCNNLQGYQLYWGDEYQQDMLVAFPHEEGLFFIHVVSVTPGEESLTAITNTCQHEIVKTILNTVRLDVTCQDMSKVLIYNCDFSTRTYNALRRYGLETVEDLLKISSAVQLRRIPGLGEKGIDEVIHKVQSYGFDISHWTPRRKEGTTDA